MGVGVEDKAARVGGEPSDVPSVVLRELSHLGLPTTSRVGGKRDVVAAAAQSWDSWVTGELTSRQRAAHAVDLGALQGHTRHAERERE